MAEKNIGKSKSTGGAKGKDGRTVKLNRDIQTQLGDQLRQMYNDVVGQGVPDKFVDLLSQLEKAERGDGEESSK